MRLKGGDRCTTPFSALRLFPKGFRINCKKKEATMLPFFIK
jgi:hypothetical protein